MPPESIESVDVVYADHAVLVLNKPAGLLSVPGRGPDKQDCLSARVQILFPDALVVHRLDMATSGLLLMARGAEAQRTLSRAFAERRVQKYYTAWVSGVVEAPLGAWQEIDLPIAPDWARRPVRTIDWQHGKASHTRFMVRHVDTQNQVSHLVLEPLTGRTHQLRVHLQAIGHPILGDALYAPPQVVAKAPRLMLHASALAFAHPDDDRPLQFTSQRLKCGCDYPTKCRPPLPLCDLGRNAYARGFGGAGHCPGRTALGID